MHFLTCSTVFLKTVFNIPLSMYWCILWLPSSNHQFCKVWTNTLSFSSQLREKIGWRKFRRSNGFRNNCIHKKSYPRVPKTYELMSHSAILLKVGFDKFIFSQLGNDRIQNIIVTVQLVVNSLTKKKIWLYANAVTLQPKYQFTHYIASAFGELRVH